MDLLLSEADISEAGVNINLTSSCVFIRVAEHSVQTAVVCHAEDRT